MSGTDSHTADALREILATCADPLNRACEEYAKLERELAEAQDIAAELITERARRSFEDRMSAASETRPTSAGEWQSPVDTVGKLIDSLKTLPSEMPFFTAYFVENDGVRVARTTVPSISYETVSNNRVQKFDAAQKSLVMWASQDEAHRCVAVPIKPTLDCYRDVWRPVRLDGRY